MNARRLLVVCLPLLLAGATASAQTPTITLSDAEGPEGNTGLTDFVFTATLSAPASSVIKVKWFTETCTADPKVPCGDGDYLDARAAPTSPMGAPPRPLTVQVVGDPDPEGQECSSSRSASRRTRRW